MIGQNSRPEGGQLAGESERSAFIVFAEFASKHVLETPEIQALVTRVWSLKPSLFHISQNALEELGPALGLDRTAYLRAFGRDLPCGTAARYFVGELRHCPLCLAKGCHSALFQLPAVAYCPIHAVRLRCGCPHCGEPVQTSAFSVGRNHLYCGKCGRSLAADRRRDSLGSDVAQLSFKRFDALRQAAWNVNGEERSKVGLDLPPAMIAASAGLSRLLARHSMWSDDQIPGLERFRIERVSLEGEVEEASGPRYHALVRNAYIDAFAELARELERSIRLEDMPTGAESGNYSGARVDAEMQLIWAAFWHAASTYGVHRYVRGEMPPPTAKASPFAFSLPRATGAMRHVVRSQVQTLFVLNLLRIRHLQYGAELAWSEMPGLATFLVPWRICQRGEAHGLELQVRIRATGAAIARIVLRYRYRRLLKAPADFELTSVLRGRA